MKNDFTSCQERDCMEILPTRWPQEHAQSRHTTYSMASQDGYTSCTLIFFQRGCAHIICFWLIVYTAGQRSTARTHKHEGEIRQNQRYNQPTKHSKKTFQKLMSALTFSLCHSTEQISGHRFQGRSCLCHHCLHCLHLQQFQAIALSTKGGAYTADVIPRR